MIQYLGIVLSSSAPFLAGGPGMGEGFTSPLSLLSLSQRLIEGSEIPKILATFLRGIPRSMASNTLSLKSFEYAFMSGSFYEDQPSRNPLSESPSRHICAGSAWCGPTGALLVRLTAERFKAGKVVRPGVTRLKRMVAAARGRTDEVTHRALAP